MAIRLLLMLNVLLCIIKTTSGSGTGYLKMKHYENPDHKDARGRCCESIFSFRCGSGECDPFFIICLGPGCAISKYQTNVYGGTDTINFGGTIPTTLGRISNPIKFTFQSLQGGLPLKIDVVDNDNGNDADDPIGSIQRTITQTPTLYGMSSHPHEYNNKNSMARILFSLDLMCDQYYFGNDCSKHCQPYPQQYNCDNNGNKVCLQGWSGPNCNIDTNPCRSNACMNGATCLNGQNSYTCICPAMYTGKFCNTIVVFTTIRPTTTQTTTTKPSTTTIATTTTNPQTTTYTPTTTTSPPTTTAGVSTTTKASTTTTATASTTTTTTITTTTTKTTPAVATTNLIPATGTISTTKTHKPPTSVRTTHSSIANSPGTLQQQTSVVTSLSYSEQTTLRSATVNQMSTNLPTSETTSNTYLSTSLYVTEKSTSGSITRISTRKTFSKSQTPTNMPYTPISITQVPPTTYITNGNITSKAIKTEEGSSSTGGIVGGLVGGLTSVGAIVSLLYYFLIRKRLKVRSEQETDTQDHNPPTETEQKQQKEIKAEHLETPANNPENIATHESESTNVTGHNDVQTDYSQITSVHVQ